MEFYDVEITIRVRVAADNVSDAGMQVADRVRSAFPDVNAPLDEMWIARVREPS